MKKTIAIALALLTVAALSVNALASGSAEAADTEAATAAAAAAVETEEGTAKTHSKGASEEIEAAVPEEDAIAAALKDAGLTEEEVTVTRIRLREKTDENGNAVVMYTIKFHTEDTTYKYHVDADTGAIIDSTVTDRFGSDSRGASEEIEAAVSEEDAIAAALKDAGFAEDDVTVTRTRLKETEDENGETVAVYTVKFHTEDTTYKYHVDANTGKIIDSTVTEGINEGSASGEPAADGEAGAVSSAAGKGGRGHKSSSEEADVTDVMTDTTNA